ncbi:hypothetical protein, partial [Caballeronia sp. GACF5]|uniref:hypothetical protein n=1 Tax=Caballeronia sp. GACF5 TaxID=2921746 RepID=UPI0020280BF1
ANILLKSELLTVTKIKSPTSAKLFKNLEVGDVIHMSIEVEYLGTNRGQPYAPYIKITNYFSGETTNKSFNELSLILK